MGWVKIPWSLGELGSQRGARWMEWQEIKFILVSVGIPVLLIACLTQLLPQLLRLL
jgi:hypothetical protein